MAPKQKPGRSKQDYSTPREFVRAVCHRLRIDDFSIDLAADKDNAVCDEFYTQEQDAIIQFWNPYGGWAWCNPPYADIEPWVAKAAKESQNGAQVAMLLPSSVGANWWRVWVEPYAYQVHLNGRLAFMPDKPKWLYPKDCTLLLYHPWGFTGHEIWRWK